MHSGSLTVVGLGFKFAGHVTEEARACIEQADQVFMMLADAFTAAWVRERNPSAQLLPFCGEGETAAGTYAAWWEQVEGWVERILACVRAGRKVCVVFYGHPGVCIPPSRELVRRTRREGFRAQTLPGISAEDCLFADLGVDPGRHGCQSYEATDFLIRRRPFSRASALILWQIGIIGAFYQRGGAFNGPGLRVLREVLEESYGAGHEVVVYEAAQHVLAGPVVRQVPLAKLCEARVTDRSTLYVPPQTSAPVDRDMLDRLGIALDRVGAVRRSDRPMGPFGR